MLHNNSPTPATTSPSSRKSSPKKINVLVYSRIYAGRAERSLSSTTGLSLVAQILILEPDVTGPGGGGNLVLSFWNGVKHKNARPPTRHSISTHTVLPLSLVLTSPTYSFASSSAAWVNRAVDFLPDMILRGRIVACLCSWSKCSNAKKRSTRCE